jgi:hypothetical protein
MGKMCAYFPVINEHIAKRNKKVSCAYASLLHLVPHIQPSLAARLRLSQKQGAKTCR